MAQTPPQNWIEQASAAAQRGDIMLALEVSTQALSEHHENAALHNDLGNLLLKSGQGERAAELFGRATALASDNLSFAINHAIALTSLGRNTEAKVALERNETLGIQSAVYCSTRGTAERGLGNLTEAAKWYDRAISLEPNRAKALHGRARVALDRAEPEAVQRFDRALAVNQGDADLWLGKAQALDVAGDTVAAREIAQALVDQVPQWIDGLTFMAQLRLGAGEADYTSHFGDAAKRAPQDWNIYAVWAETLAGLDHNEQATQIAAEARSRFPEQSKFTLLEAVFAGQAGDDERAEAVFASLSLQNPERWLQEARHRIRQKQFGLAASLIDKVLEEQPDSISAWALRGVIWRMVDDSRSVWLSEQAGLVTLLPLENAENVLSLAIPLLHKLHDGSPLPLGQSLRGGSQTRGILFDRTEPELGKLKRAIEQVIADYQSALPAADQSHPLLRHRHAEWSLAGSWSVRLSGSGDYHTAHIHPQGIVSSALYLEVPKSAQSDPHAGWLEVGRPAPDLRTELPPLRTIEPRPGHLALFPSTLYHGTRPFTGSQRMTVAFDVTLRQNTP